jgi:hypothetical protein
VVEVLDEIKREYETGVDQSGVAEHDAVPRVLYVAVQGFSTFLRTWAVTVPYQFAVSRFITE